MFVLQVIYFVVSVCLLIYFCTYADRLQHCKMIVQGIAVVIIMFYCKHNKSVSGYYGDAMLVNINNVEVTLKKTVE